MCLFAVWLYFACSLIAIECDLFVVVEPDVAASGAVGVCGVSVVVAVVVIIVIVVVVFVIVVDATLRALTIYREHEVPIFGVKNKMFQQFDIYC